MGPGSIYGQAFNYRAVEDKLGSAPFNLLAELALDFLQRGSGGAQFGVRLLEIGLRLAQVRARVAAIVERLAPVLDRLGPGGHRFAPVLAEPAALGLGRGLACREGLVVFGLRPG